MDTSSLSMLGGDFQHSGTGFSSLWNPLNKGEAPHVLNKRGGDDVFCFGKTTLTHSVSWGAPEMKFVENGRFWKTVPRRACVAALMVLSLPLWGQWQGSTWHYK